MSQIKSKSDAESAATSATTSVPQLPSPFVPTKPPEELAKLYTTLGAQQVKKRSEIQAFGRSDWRKIVEREYVTMHEAKMNTTSLLESTMDDNIPVWCKEVRLAQCTPRYRANLLERSLPIQRYLLRGGRTVDVYDDNGGPTKSRYFAAIFNVFLADNVLYMFMVPRNGGSLHDRLKDCKSPPKPNQIRQWVGQLVKAVGAMHDHGVAHRSLKLKHVLLHGSALEVQVASWNRAVHYWDQTTEPGQVYLLLQHRERRSRKNRHLPPECFSCPSTGGYDPSKVDLWSVGVIAVALATRRYPFNPHCKFSFRAQWASFMARYAPPCEYLKKTLAMLLEFDPMKRQPSGQVLKCQYFDAKLDLNKLAQSKKSPDSPVPLTGSKTKTAFSSTPASSSSSSSQVSGVKTATGKTKPLKRSASQDSKSSIKSQTKANSQTKKTDSKVKCGSKDSKNKSRTSSNKTVIDVKSRSATGSTISSSQSSTSQSAYKSKSGVTSKGSANKSKPESKKTNKVASASRSSSGSSVVSSTAPKSAGSLPSSPKTPATGRQPEMAFDPGQDNASGNEGGAVNESLPPEERKYEDLEQSRQAVEESETQARVVRINITGRCGKA